MQHALAAVAATVAAMYIVIALFVAPRLWRIGAASSWTRRGQVGATAVLLGGAIAHAIAALDHLQGGDPGAADAIAHLLPYLAQLAGGALLAAAVARMTGVQGAAETEVDRLRAQVSRDERLLGLGQLAGSVAHDFNNLLAVILSFAQFVKSAVKDDSVSQDVDQIIQAAERGADLTKQLMLFSRRQAPRRETVDIAAELQRLEPFLCRMLGRSVTLELSTRDDLAPVRLGAGQLDQVVVNLAMNARDAMPNGRGTLRISTSSHVAEGRRFTRLCVRDDGAGMAPEVVEQAFERFFTTKGLGEGTGFGLATVQAIVGASGGHAAIESEEGSGTTITLDFPAQQPKPVVEAPEPPAQPVNGLRVLLVEDNEIVRRGIERMLEPEVELRSAGGGPDALAAFDRERPPDVVVTDLAMPGMTGAELATHLRERQPSVGLVCMSGWLDPGVPSMLPERVVLINKPFTKDGLLAAIREASDRACG